MFVERLKLTNFKNYDELEVSFSNNVNCFVGNNGVGKTNLLDALYYLSFCKSCFTSSDVQNIKHGADFFAIHGYYSLDGNDDELSQVSCVLQVGHPKKMKFNKKTYSTFAEHIGKIPLVMVTPGDHSIILGGSDVRRKFVDGIISQTDTGYLHHLLAYSKALEQRNALLKQFFDNRYFDEPAISLWDEQLLAHGDVIMESRNRFVAEFIPLFEQYYFLIYPGAAVSEKPQLEYCCNIEENGAASMSSGSFAAVLSSLRKRDAFLQYTSAGPHKDDFDFKIGDVSVKRFGSQGQQKTFLLALKLAQFDYLCSHLHVKPILLLDDVFDKLDMNRVRQLVMLVASERFGQVFITDTQQGRVESIFEQASNIPHSIFSVCDGRLTGISTV